MMAELCVYGLVAGLLMRYVHTGKTGADVYISLAVAMVAGRGVAGLVQALLLLGGGAYGLRLWLTAYFYTALPGIALQMVIIPGILFALERGRLIPPRY
jgi:niacin transporter